MNIGHTNAVISFSPDGDILATGIEIYKNKTN